MSGESRSGELVSACRGSTCAACRRGRGPLGSHKLAGSLGGEPRWQGIGSVEVGVKSEPHNLCVDCLRRVLTPLLASHVPSPLNLYLVWSKSGREIYRKGHTRKKSLPF